MFNKRGWREFVYSVWKGSANRLDRYQERNVRSPVPIKVQRDRRRPDREKRITGCDTRWRYPPYRLNLTAYH